MGFEEETVNKVGKNLKIYMQLAREVHVRWLGGGIRVARGKLDESYPVSDGALFRRLGRGRCADGDNLR